jgi:hypothetical protein
VLRTIGLEVGLVGEEPEDFEVGIRLAVEHGLQVELDEGLADEAFVVAQDAELKAVGDDAPQVSGGPIEEFLKQRMGAGT